MFRGFEDSYINKTIKHTPCLFSSQAEDRAPEAKPRDFYLPGAGQLQFRIHPLPRISRSGRLERWGPFELASISFFPRCNEDFSTPASKMPLAVAQDIGCTDKGRTGSRWRQSRQGGSLDDALAAAYKCNCSVQSPWTRASSDTERTQHVVSGLTSVARRFTMAHWPMGAFFTPQVRVGTEWRSKRFRTGTEYRHGVRNPYGAPIPEIRGLVIRFGDETPSEKKGVDYFHARILRTSYM
ncbi:hypothetical protein V8C37DRAFT_374578 [Trichoderma ceciliae]